jgi:hypothetical protein
LEEQCAILSWQYPVLLVVLLNVGQVKSINTLTFIAKLTWVVLLMFASSG